jgi:hypothetical protein
VTQPRGSRLEGLDGVRPLAPSRPGRFLVLLLLLPGGLLILAGIFVASVGFGLCWPGLRRMTAASRGVPLPESSLHGASPDSDLRLEVMH